MVLERPLESVTSFVGRVASSASLVSWDELAGLACCSVSPVSVAVLDLSSPGARIGILSTRYISTRL